MEVACGVIDVRRNNKRQWHQWSPHLPEGDVIISDVTPVVTTYLRVTAERGLTALPPTASESPSMKYATPVRFTNGETALRQFTPRKLTRR